MIVKAMTALMTVAYRKARREGGRLWWAVLVVAWLIRRSEVRAKESRSYTIKNGSIEVAAREAS
jgi:hypothetical protein